jgi:hypothetical protein
MLRVDNPKVIGIYTQSHWRCGQAAKELSPMSLDVLSDWGESSQQSCSFEGDGYIRQFAVENYIQRIFYTVNPIRYI